MNDYWLKQADKPLFADLLWSRPENRQHAGKLLIIGGNAHGFAAPAEAFAVAEKSGIGTCRVLLPDHIRPQIMKFQGPSLAMEFAPSTPSGSFAANSLAELIEASHWADAVLLAGDLGRNSETAIVLEKFVSKTLLPIVISKDANDYFTSTPETVLNRENTCLVLSLAQLQKLFQNAKFHIPIKFSMDTLHLVEALHEFTSQHKIMIVSKHLENIFVSVNGQVSSTKSQLDIEDAWRVPVAAKSVVWWLQNLSKPFESLTTSLIE